MEQTDNMQQQKCLKPILSVVMMSMTGLVVLLAVGPQSVQGRNFTFDNWLCTIRDSDDELVSCTGNGTSL